MRDTFDTPITPSKKETPKKEEQILYPDSDDPSFVEAKQQYKLNFKIRLAKEENLDQEKIKSIIETERNNIQKNLDFLTVDHLENHPDVIRDRAELRALWELENIDR